METTCTMIKTEDTRPSPGMFKICSCLEFFKLYTLRDEEYLQAQVVRRHAATSNVCLGSPCRRVPPLNYKLGKTLARITSFGTVNATKRSLRCYLKSARSFLTWSAQLMSLHRFWKT